MNTSNYLHDYKCKEIICGNAINNKNVLNSSGVKLTQAMQIAE